MDNKMRDWRTYNENIAYSTNIHLKTNKKNLKRNQTCKFAPDHVFNLIRRHYNITTVLVIQCCKLI